MNDRPHIFGLTRDELQALLADAGMPRFRTDQVLDWVYRRGVIDPQAMTNLSKADRQELDKRLIFSCGQAVRHLHANDGTQKLLLDWSAGEAGGVGQTECVMIPSQDARGPRRTACVSSQVGCPVGCTFCASGIGGLEANLHAGQIVEQVWRLAQLPGVQRISNVVFMGMGEPLANLDQVVRAARILTADWAMGISARRITISTVGLPAQIRRLAQIDLPVTLAISLHAPNDELRRQIIPWAKFVSIEQLVDAGQCYFEKTGREVTLEYILLGEFNDQVDHARQLAEVASRLRSNVNLIRYNEVPGLEHRRPADADVRRFQRVLRESGVNAHIRASRGRDIAAACGQLRHEQRRRGAPVGGGVVQIQGK